jgi:DNA (cytosine-5)-methyltransferase 1
MAVWREWVSPNLETAMRVLSSQSSEVIRRSVLSIGENKGQPRLWIEGQYLDKAGFTPGSTVKTEYGNNQITITLASGGDHTVSCGRKSGRAPVLDYNSSAIRDAIANASKVEVCTRHGTIVITPAKSEVKRATRLNDDSCATVFSGGGLLDEAMKQSGYKTRFGIEISPDYADVFQSNHPGTMYCSCISEVDIRSLPQVSLLGLGIPCEPFSAKRRNTDGKTKREGTDPTDHDLADMSFWGLMVIDQCNPNTVVIENVPAYLDSEIGQVTQAALRRMGYNVDARIICGPDHGALTTRKRGIIIAADREIVWPEMRPSTRTLGSILLDPTDDRCEWFHKTDSSKRWIFDHWQRQSAKGNGFASQQLTSQTPAVQTISKRYFAGQGDAPIVRDERPGRDGWFRWLTLDEVKAIMGLPMEYNLGTAKTFAGEVMGQGVLVDVFKQIIKAVAPKAKRKVA